MSNDTRGNPKKKRAQSQLSPRAAGGGPCGRRDPGPLRPTGVRLTYGERCERARRECAASAARRLPMAVGWESKSVEEQINDREAVTGSARRPLTTRQAEEQSRRDGILLLRARTLADMASTRHERRRVELERAL